MSIFYKLQTEPWRKSLKVFGKWSIRRIDTNGLNTLSRNRNFRRFFEICDAIVLDFRYINSFLTNRTAIGYKNKRPRSVHIGVDVAGERCPGGGGFNLAFVNRQPTYFLLRIQFRLSRNDVKMNYFQALDKIRRQGLSVAILNPSWTYQNFGSEKFLKIENIFWAQLVPDLYFHVPIYKKEPFYTSFCRGYGTQYYSNSEVKKLEKLKEIIQY